MTDQPLTIGKVLVSTYSGVDLIVTPLTFQARAMLQRASEAKYEMPDPTPYERKSTMRELGSDDFATIPAESNPDYITAVERVTDARTRFINDAALAVSVTHPQQDVLVNAYAAELTAFRAMSPDDVPENDWAAVVRLFLASEPELMQIYAVISRQAPLTEGEIRDSMSYFRLDVGRLIVPGVSRQSRSRSVASAESDTAQRAG
jgi:hypothetical protein